MKKTLLLIVCLCIVGINLEAQRNCGSHEHMLDQLEENPQMEINMQAIEKFTNKYLENPLRLNGEIITIPVVFHIVYKTSAQNVSDAQIQSQLDVLNDDFRRMNADADDYWGDLGTDTEIEFCLASVDPNGNSTNGVQRQSTDENSFAYSGDPVKFNSSGGIDAWPADDYLNFWVCNLEGGLLGYAQFPGGPDATDGVVVDYAYFGTIGTATPPFDLGRTATHEVGHWLNLRHIWGDGGCGADDFVSDTPKSNASNGGCQIGSKSCGSDDMVQNYMDYSDDACMNLFTVGQSARMDALFASGGARESLLTSGGCGGDGGPPETCSDGILNNGETEVDCGGPNCEPCGGEETCSDGILNNGETEVDCGGPNCEPCGGEESCTDGILNNGETEVDCGGPNCDPCDGGGTCDTPSGTFASKIKPKRAQLNWSAVGSATSYNIQIDEAGQTNWNDFSASSTKITISGLSNGQSYDWRVQAVCGGDLSAWSSICSFTAGNSSSGDCGSRVLVDINKDVILFPNPASETISITDVNQESVINVQIMGLNGQAMITASVQDAIRGITIQSLNPGIYLMKVNFIDNTADIKKFVIIN